MCFGGGGNLEPFIRGSQHEAMLGCKLLWQKDLVQYLPVFSSLTHRPSRESTLGRCPGSNHVALDLKLPANGDGARCPIIDRTISKLEAFFQIRVRRLAATLPALVTMTRLL